MVCAAQCFALRAGLLVTINTNLVVWGEVRYRHMVGYGTGIRYHTRRHYKVIGYVQKTHKQ